MTNKIWRVPVILSSDLTMSSHLGSDAAVLNGSVEGLMGTCDDRIIRMGVLLPPMCGWRCLAAPESTPPWNIPRTVHRHKTQALLLIIDLECALDKNLVERKAQAVDRQHCGRPRSTLVRHKRERYIRPCAETRDIGCPGKRRGVRLHAGTCHLAGHIHCILRELTVARSGTGRGRSKRQTVQLARNSRAGAFGVKGYRGDHRNEVRRSCPAVNDGRARSSRDSPTVILRIPPEDRSS